MAQTLLRDYLQETEDRISAKRFDDALERCQRVLGQFPEALEVQRLLGEIYLAQGQLEEAQQIFDWVLTNDPENVVVYCDRALISERMSDVDTALDCYQQAYELSRGNGQIRLEFNQLSTRSGQQSFMLSRAGLARLYMRGDLLEQAIQEWEAVLAATPDRLDARVGLLEACWREGLYERAEQIARHVLQDVPGCLKALVLLAFITSTKNANEAQQFVQRAEVLDPELLIAQDLFVDLQASQSDHPLLKLLKKEPVLLTTTDASSANKPVSVPIANIANGGTASADLATSDTFSQWNTMDYWNGADTLDNPQPQEQQPVAEAVHSPFSFEGWESSTASNAWDMLGKLPDQPTAGIQELAPYPTSPQKETLNNENEAEFSPAQGAGNTFDAVEHGAQQDQEQQYAFDAWAVNGWSSSPVQAEKAQSFVPEPAIEQGEPLMESPSDTFDMWNGGNNSSLEENSWQAFSSAGEAQQSSTPPSWLNMLSQREQQNEPVAPAVQSKEVVKPAEPLAVPLAQAPTKQQPVQSKEQSNAEHGYGQGDEEFSFGPAWLKSLGAASFDGGISEGEAVSPFSEPTPTFAQQQPYDDTALASAHDDSAFDDWQLQKDEAQPTFEAWTSQVAEPEPLVASQQAQATESLPETSFSAWSTSNADSAAPIEQSFLATLEHLESGLRSQGFVQHEPNSLSSIAEKQSLEPTQPVQEEDEKQVQDVRLSSALAELGKLDQRGPVVSQPAAPSTIEHTPRTTPGAPAEEPLWAAALRATPAPAPVKSAPQVQPPVRRTTQPLQPAAAMQAGEPQSTWSSPSPMRVDALPGPIFTPTPEPVTNVKKPEPQKVPVSRVEMASSDFELETTMKRPAVRLQSMQAQRPTPTNTDKLATGAKNRASEQPLAGKTLDNGGNYRERLVRGYQHQLVGDYDEAMQEYRIIIRNVPELLADVVSNVRALLKLAPKYAAGYRVLGDAYMRQGEYLQAMEAYNKALTMAKKARG